MNSRERVLSALNHVQPDRVPLDFWAHRSSGISAVGDAINPVQISCAGMNAADLKSRYGDRLTFWGGGCDTHRVLSFGKPEEIRQHVAKQVATLSPGGGFVFQQVHNIQADIPPKNILAMFGSVGS